LRVPEVVACLPGDGIGPEVLEQAVRVLEHLPLDVEAVRLPFGGVAIDEFGDPLPAQTLATCRSARAVLLGAGRRPEVGRRQRPARGRSAGAAQGARRLRQSPPSHAG